MFEDSAICLFHLLEEPSQRGEQLSQPLGDFYLHSLHLYCYLLRPLSHQLGEEIFTALVLLVGLPLDGEFLYKEACL